MWVDFRDSAVLFLCKFSVFLDNPLYKITYRYAHLFPSKQAEMADRLDDLGKGDF